MTPDIEKLRISVADGKATAKMSRGSFRHRDRIKDRRTLETVSVSRDGGAKIELRDPLTGRTCMASESAVHLPKGSACGGISLIKIDTDGLGTNRLMIEFPADASEHIYGCGETFSEFDLKGHMVRIWVAEHQNATRIAGKMLREKIIGVRPDIKLPFEMYESYYAQPTFMSDKGYFVHIDGNFYMEFDFRKKDRTRLMLRGNADIYVGEAGSWEGLSEGLSFIVGRQPRLPDYLHDGIIIASQRGIASIEDKIESARRHGIPVTGFWCQDWCGCRETEFGYQVMWNWQWDDTLYKDLPAKIAEWKEQGIRFFGYINPFMAVEGPVYREASEKGYCVKNADGEDYMVTITTFPAAMIDLTNPDAVTWYKDIIKNNMIGIGMSGWMADFGEYLPTDAVLHSRKSAEEKHNEWPALWAKLNREAVDECGAGDEVFFFMRAGHTGSISNATLMWNGDQHVDWSADLGIRTVIPASLSFALSGVGVCHSDIGGYTSIMHMKRSRELMMRWAELCCYSPVMRMHEGNRPDANIQFDADPGLLDHIARMGKLHIVLKDYLKDALKEYYDKGIPVMRPVFYHDDQSSLHGIDDEYLLGRDILVAPVMREGSRSRSCILPEGEWIHLFTERAYSGGKHSVAAPVGRPPVFIRKDSRYADAVLRGTNGVI